MNTIEILEALLQSHLRDTKIIIDESGAIQAKTEALTEAIDSLKCDKVARIREYAETRVKQLKSDQQRMSLKGLVSLQIRYANQSSEIEQVIGLIDQLDKEQA